MIRKFFILFVVAMLSSMEALTQASPKIESLPQTLLVQEGDNVTLHCALEDLGDHAVAWHKEDHLISGMMRGALTKITDDPRLVPSVSELVLHRVVAADSGIYTCSVGQTMPQGYHDINASSTAQNYGEILQLSHNLTVIRTTKEYEATGRGNVHTDYSPFEGTSVELSCAVSGIPRPLVQWTKYAFSTSAEENCGCTDSNFKTSRLPPQPLGVRENLTFANVRRSDSGIYSCSAYNGIGQVETLNITMRVMFAPSVKVPVRKVYSGKDVSTVLCCDSDAHPPPSVTWYKMQTPENPYRSYDPEASEPIPSDGLDGFWTNDRHSSLTFSPENNPTWSPVSPTRLKKAGCQNRHTAFSRNTLSIPRFREADLGTYRCIASNPLGNDSAYISVTGEPWSLFVVSETHTNLTDSYTLAWQVNSYNEILRYEVSVEKTRQASEESSPARNYTVPAILTQMPVYHSQVKHLTGLSPGSLYRVNIRAYNSYGYVDLDSPFIFHTLGEDGSYASDHLSGSSTSDDNFFPTDYSDTEVNLESRPPELLKFTTERSSAEIEKRNNMVPHSRPLQGNVSLNETPSTAPPRQASPKELGALLTAIALSAFFSLSASRWCAG
ncbi:hemicentin-2 [Hyalella azteca]|uniref:Hemicentin-2 n=1 Tax=Hyalella azteca TaxID=294128 RepID=A0A8B7N7J0_HYAAZ|nr:hemicentin-2 [Hyalella azteca]